MGERLSQLSFAGGEISPELYARVDLARYATGLRSCRNFVVKKQGGVANRAGFRFVAEVKDSTRKVRLVPFVFSNDQAYVLEFGHLYIRLHQLAAPVFSAGVPFEIVTPYQESELEQLDFAQSADVVTVVHPLYAPRELKRLAHTNWTLTTPTFQPSISAPTNVALENGSTSSAASLARDWSWVVTAISTTGEESLPSTALNQKCKVQGDEAYADRPKISWDPVAGADHYNIYRGQNGWYGFVGQSKKLDGGLGKYVFDDDGRIPAYALTPPRGNSPFSGAGEYPSTVCFFQQRRVFANSINKPQTVWMTQSGVYNSFSAAEPPADDEAITLTIASLKLDEIRALVPHKSLLLFTGGAEYKIGQGQDDVVTPFNSSPQIQSYYGAARLRPALVGDTFLFVDRTGSALRDFMFTYESDGYSGNDVSVLASHLLLKHSIVSLAYQSKPWSIVWLVRDDGTLLGLTYERENQILAWHQHDTDGTFESICVVPEDGGDYLYAAVQRSINGQTKRYIERQAKREPNPIEDAFFVDSGLTFDGRNSAARTMTLTSSAGWTVDTELDATSSDAYFTVGDVGAALFLDTDTGVLKCLIDSFVSATNVRVVAQKDVPLELQGVATTAWSKAIKLVDGLTHLEAKTVAILADGNVHPTRVVNSGRIELQHHAAVIHAGLPYVSELQTLDLNVAGARLEANKGIVTAVTVHIIDGRGLQIGEDQDNLYEFPERDPADGYSTPIAAKERKATMTLSRSWNLGGRYLLRQADPLPVEVIAVYPEVTIGGSAR